jgi:hypothetical protein
MSNRFQQHKTKTDMTRYVSACTVYAILWGIGVIVSLVTVPNGAGIWGLLAAAGCAWFGYLRAREVVMYFAMRRAYLAGDSQLREDPDAQAWFET